MELRKKDKEAGVISDVVRSARFVEQDEGWFFRTREGILLGPYADKFDAEISASILVARLAQLDEDKDPSVVIQAFENDPANATVARTRASQPIDVKQIKRRQQMRTARGTLLKAWTAISQLKTESKQASPRGAA